MVSENQEDKLSRLVSKARQNGLETEAIRTILKKHGADEDKVDSLLGNTESSTPEVREAEHNEDSSTVETSKDTSKKEKEGKKTGSKKKQRKPSLKKQAKKGETNSETNKSSSSKEHTISQEKVRRIVRKAKSKEVTKEKVKGFLTKKGVTQRMQETVLTEVYGKKKDQEETSKKKATEPLQASEGEERGSVKTHQTEKESEEASSKPARGERESSVEYDPERESLDVNTISVTGTKIDSEEYEVKGLDDIIYGEEEKSVEELDEEFRSQNEMPEVPGFEK